MESILLLVNHPEVILLELMVCGSYEDFCYASPFWWSLFVSGTVLLCKLVLDALLSLDLLWYNPSLLLQQILGAFEVYYDTGQSN